jgi:hypothetical protein
MPSIYTIWAHYTYIDINEKGTIGSPSTGYHSTMSYYQKPPSRRPTPMPTPPVDVKKSWRKTHMSVEELPFRRPSAELYRGSVLTAQDTRMKALPTTPLPTYGPGPLSPKTPASAYSMQLPVILETPLERSY